ncbi:2-hydroxyacid dehydrogenase [Kineococcus gynurae]|uniref:2-hydroxyacid dehydrogenase n=1 Tax=Kineococcus gynurae TaxID=452979 RepID=A0ABV5LVV4_9ACTN
MTSRGPETPPAPAGATPRGATTLRVTLPSAAWVAGVGPLPGVEFSVWDLGADWTGPEPHVVVPPYMGRPPYAERLAGRLELRLVQLLTNGYDGVPEQLPPGVALSNAAGVHEASTAELALGLVLASRRGIDDAARGMATGEWAAARRPALADSSVLVVGWGGVGRAVGARLRPFEVELTALASTPRVEDGVTVHGPEDLPRLLPAQDVVILACPLSEQTRGLVDAGFLAAMRDGALLVNVARGPVVDTGALLAETAAGRLRAALDVTDPEPLPPAHPLWRTPGVLITPHVGGNSTAFRPRAVRLLRRQLATLAAGGTPENVVAG